MVIPPFICLIAMNGSMKNNNFAIFLIAHRHVEIVKIQICHNCFLEVMLPKFLQLWLDSEINSGLFPFQTMEAVHSVQVPQVKVH